MAKDPAFLFYTKDWLSGCQFMSFEERGIYITLLCAQHQNGHLDIKRVGFLLGFAWDSVSDIVKSKFLFDDDGLIFNARLDEEIEKRANFIEKQRNNGLKGGRPRKEKTQTKSQNKPKINPTGNGDANVIGNEKEYKKESEIDFTKPDIDGDEIMFPIDTPAMRKLWSSWKEARWSNYGVRYAMHGEQAALRQLANMNFHEIEQAIQQAIASNWKNLYPEKNGKQHSKTTKQQQSDATGEYLKQYYSAKTGGQ